jgi:hypothetical protein
MGNVKEAARKKSLGELGELFAMKALVDNEFDKIRNLNDRQFNEPFADIECEKGGKNTSSVLRPEINFNETAG